MYGVKAYPLCTHGKHCIDTLTAVIPANCHFLQTWHRQGVYRSVYEAAIQQASTSLL